MSGRIFRSVFTAAVAVLLASLLVITGCMADYFGSVQERELRDELGLAAVATEEMGTAYLQHLRGEEYRLTWVSADGSVRYDTQVDAQGMENHGDREEIREALAEGSGSSCRYSATLTEKTLYEAVRLSDGSVLRISVSRATVLRLMLGMISPMLAIAASAMVLSVVLAKRMARRIVEPLNRLDLEHPLENEVYEELSPLLRRIHAQHQQIDEQVQNLKQKTEEFQQITGSMREGLVLLDSQGVILSMNPAACGLFQTDDRCVGQHFLTVDRAQDLNGAIQDAMDRGHSEIRGERGGRTYQFDLSRIPSEDAVLGVVLLAFDVTEQAGAERMRREFTANVSHELKTPLQSIIGSAELLQNGLVKREDVPRFVGHIRQEASRLVALIEDIIRISQLDEGGELPREEVSLRAVSQEVISALTPAAQERQVCLSVTGEGTVFGVRRLLYEILYNLCDNGIRYQAGEGSVQIRLWEQDGATVMAVEDTGIGIPPEHQSRVFERFYRVDQSHSKQSGGTGLGLSIVKHAVQKHGGSITMESTWGKGTTITVSIPKGGAAPAGEMAEA